MECVGIQMPKIRQYLFQMLIMLKSNKLQFKCWKKCNKSEHWNVRFRVSSRIFITATRFKLRNCPGAGLPTCAFKLFIPKFQTARLRLKYIKLVSFASACAALQPNKGKAQVGETCASEPCRAKARFLFSGRHLNIPQLKIWVIYTDNHLFFILHF